MFKILTVCVTVCIFALYSVECEDRNYIWNVFNKAGGFKAFTKIDVWRESYRKTFFDNLDKLPKTARDKLIAKADTNNKKQWVSKLAMQYLEFVINGNRVNFETTDVNRRVQFADLVIGELLTRNGTYINQICNGLWLIMEESSWETPGHLPGTQKSGPGLPDPYENVIDLRVGEMASTIAITKLLLRESLDKVNKMFVKRIDYELNRRIFNPYLNDDTWFWLGFKGQSVNNHNTWVNTNILRTALLAIDDENLRNQVVNRSIKSIDIFINQYPNDGGCDEGPGYWEWAGGRLIDYIDLFDSISNTSMSWRDNELIKKIGSYIYKMHISANRYVNFADAHATLDVEAPSVFKYGLYFNDTVMKEFASYVSSIKTYEAITTVTDFLGSLWFFINTLLTLTEIPKSRPKAPLLKQNYFENLQVVTARTKAGTTDGLFLGAKAGTNFESHNHNDVGNFIIYFNGNPFIIDVGVGVYTNVTFSGDRYSIWSMQSQWHNCPTINGVQQKDGTNYFASNVSFSSTNDSIKFVANIAGAYPKEAQVKSWLRTIEFNENLSAIKVSENYELTNWTQPLKLHFISHLNITNTSGDIHFNSNNGTISLKYDPNIFDIVLDHQNIASNENELRKTWGNAVYRATLTQKNDIKETDRLKGEIINTFSIV